MKYLSIKAQMQELRRLLAGTKLDKGVYLYKIHEPKRPHSIGVLYKPQRGVKQGELHDLLNSFKDQQQQEHPGVTLAQIKLLGKL